MFRWIIQNVEREGAIVEALTKAVREVPGCYSSLNFLPSYELRRNPIDDQLEEFRSNDVNALLHSKALRKEKAVLVCSERLTDEKWESIPLGHLLAVGGDLEPKLFKVP